MSRHKQVTAQAMAAELRAYADRLEMRLGAVRRAIDELDPPRKRRRRRRKASSPTAAETLEQVERVGESLAAIREGARRAGEVLR